MRLDPNYRVPRAELARMVFGALLAQLRRVTVRPRIGWLVVWPRIIPVFWAAAVFVARGLTVRLQFTSGRIP